MPDFYRFSFDDVGEGADLVAALSRQVASSRAENGDDAPIEVGIVARSGGADVYASAGALAAIERAVANPPRAFASLPLAAKADALPQNVIWILQDGERKFLGRGDVLSKIMPEPTEPLYTHQSTIGVVKFWRDDKGYGVIESPETKPWGIWCSFASIEPAGGVATLPTGEQFPVTYDESGRAFSPSGKQVISGHITGGGFRSLAVGERVAVRYYRTNQESYKYVARWVRRIGQFR
jgi:cold shock CspA family protein